MSEIPFLYQAVLELLIGILIIAPLIYAIKSIISHIFKFSPLVFSETLRRIALPEPVIVGERGSLGARIGSIILNLLFLVLHGSKY
jgi:hypothetical protein